MTDFPEQWRAMAERCQQERKRLHAEAERRDMDAEDWENCLAIATFFEDINAFIEATPEL